MKKQSKCWTNILSGVATLFLMMWLTSCVTIPAPPAQYLEDCKVTYLGSDPVDNTAIVKLAIDREHDVKYCNLDKRAIRAYYDGYREACGWRCRLGNR